MLASGCEEDIEVMPMRDAHVIKDLGTAERWNSDGSQRNDAIVMQNSIFRLEIKALLFLCSPSPFFLKL